ncbi:MAG: LysM peptidoglycan-binding domain-containing protein [Chloroflexi bacterium]|nr:MAG: LysM peptidoglycan-binding domain-containing protein [Chloroflexota bacterium]
MLFRVLRIFWRARWAGMGLLLGVGLWTTAVFPLPVLAQTAGPTVTPEATPVPEPVLRTHIVQEGETPISIALNYGITLEELLLVNNLDENDLLYVGQSLIIPGGEGESVATVYTVQAGDTLAGIAEMFLTTPEAIARTNRMIYPEQDLVIGQRLVVISRTGSALPAPLQGRPYLVQPGESLTMVAARFALSEMMLAEMNGLSLPAYLMPGQRLRIPADGVYRSLPGEWKDVRIRPLPFVRGNTLSIYVENLQDGVPTGSLAGQTLRFTPYEDGFVALVGLDSFTEPGIYPLELNGSGTRPWTPFRQLIKVEAGEYTIQSITVPEEMGDLLAPEIRQREDEFLHTIYTQFTEEQMWNGLFQMPVTNTIVTARYGDGRSYNGGPIEIFHTGVDFAGTVGTPILAPANGVVVYTGTLQLRGNTVIIDHGLGVMSAYFHLSDIFVQPGEFVVAGQPIAAGGSTGLSTGPHLHWDLRVQGVAVNGIQWTQVPFP